MNEWAKGKGILSSGKEHKQGCGQTVLQGMDLLTQKFYTDDE